MSKRSLTRGLGIALALATAPALAGASRCDLPDAIGARELHQRLGLRAVELVRRAADPGQTLKTLVAPGASFNIGASDVGRTLAQGTAGARELAQIMHADTYRFLGWDYMDSPDNGCAPHKIAVEFIDSQTRTVSRMEFGFDAGRVVSASGWQRSFETGLVTPASTP